MNSNKGTLLCVLSLLCMFLAPIIIFIIGAAFMSGDISGATADAYAGIFFWDGVSYIAAWVLAIVSRARYKNKFSLVLLIVYGALLGLSIIGIGLLLLLFAGAL